jgi:hypothetical protein
MHQTDACFDTYGDGVAGVDRRVAWRDDEAGEARQDFYRNGRFDAKRPHFDAKLAWFATD